ncbi:nuclear migration protein [Niveomyces insectorum RCEF 264]|uniref:Nuclear migration protein n=1 Tax=Niveomyces insectorum RCEF 264 TaxID=1081102 RepID=A0A167W5I7_9HYPO|nr:nuclear migration protein [Niveomyces insectorum RCEF 264]
MAATQPDGSPVTPTPHQRPSGVERPFALHPPAMAMGAGSSHHYRFADFDEGTFSERAGVSAEQAKRALRSHLAETERRMAEAGRLGTALVQQQKELTEKLREVEELQAESELSPELKKKLSELEKEYDDVARETARAFLPKQRIPSNESSGSPEGKSGRRSLSPVKYESHASGSPSKLTVSNRKQRNQAANRVHDIEFAAEISTSLISQVRGLQSLLSEREEELRDTKQDLVRLEDISETLRDRIKELDESEHRYKEENWNLETRLHDLEAAQRDAADNEKKVAQQLAVLQADKNKAQREFDELKASHARLVDEHTASVKHHDIELGTAKRNIAMADGEKASLQRKIDELASQNQELARAVSMQHRARAVESDAVPVTSDDEFDTAADNITPEHSPPASPVKGTPRHSVLESETLKTSLLHAQRTLQSLRTNLHREKTEKLELRRMLQDTRDELERVRSDPTVAGAGASKKTRKDAREAHGKLRSSQLGGARSSRTDLFTLASADPDWEEVQREPSPSAVRPRISPVESSDHFETANEADMTDTSFATANDGAETTEDFHTGAEEPSSGEDTMTETEQGTRRRRTALASRTASAATATRLVGDADADADADAANQSTASTSDDDEFKPPRTPTAALPSSTGVARMRLRVSRSSLVSRRLRHMSSVEETGGSPAALQSSPFSAAGSPATIGLAASSANSTPRAPGQQQSLFAELDGLGEQSDEDIASEGTPSRQRSPGPLALSGFGGSTSSGANSIAHSPLPLRVPSPKVVMVDRATLTDAVTILPWSEAEEQQPEQAGHGLFQDSRPSSFLSDDGLAAHGDLDMGEKLKEFPSPPTSTPRRGPIFTPIVLSPPDSQPIAIGREDDDLHEDRSVIAISEPRPEFTISNVVSVPVEPLCEPEPTTIDSVDPPPVVLAFSSMVAEHVEPQHPLPQEPLIFSTSTLHAVNITPTELPPLVVAELEAPAGEPLMLSFSAIQQQQVAPILEPEAETAAVVPVEPFSLSKIWVQQLEPIAEPEPEPRPAVVVPSEPLSLSEVQVQQVLPISEPQLERGTTSSVEAFSVSELYAQHVLPVSELEPEPARDIRSPVEPLTFSGLQIQHVEPITAQETLVAPQFSVSRVQGEQIQPLALPREPTPSMNMSQMYTQQVQPLVSDEVKGEPLPAAAVAQPSAPYISVDTQTDEWKPELKPPAMAAFQTSAIVGASLTAATASSIDDAFDDFDTESKSRSPKRNAFIIPRDFDATVDPDETARLQEQPSTPSKRAVDSLFGGWSKHRGPPTPVIAEDETRQSPNATPLSGTPESQRPFKELSVNANAPRTKQDGEEQRLALEDQIFMPAARSPNVMEDEETLDITPRAANKVFRDDGVGSASATAASGRHVRDVSQDSNSSVIHGGRNMDGSRAGLVTSNIRRPGSASSGGRISSDLAAPPLPANHREAIEAARTGSAGSAFGEAGLSSIGGAIPTNSSTWRAHTPIGVSRDFNFVGESGTPTPKAVKTHAVGDMRPPSRPSSRTNASHTGASAAAGFPSTISRQTSVSSFASEVDARFNIHDGADVFGNSHGHTDPRMIQAITQTMIGEYLWKYTRKTGRSGLSENRHRRYFWIHPYTRMLYWSDQGPTPGSRSEQRAKSVVIEGVRVVADDNTMPPGLHRKSLVVISPGRTIKFTCPTGHRHEIWFNALSYLLLRNEEGAEEDGMMANGDRITQEDVAEFNPAFGQRPTANARARRHPPVSLSSYNSRTTRNESPAFNASMNIPTLTPTPKKSMPRTPGTTMTPSASVAGLTSRSRLSRIGGYWRSSQSLSAQFNSLRGRNSALGHRHTGSGAQDSSIYEASEVNDSAEELRVLYEAQDRASDRLENVRACCDGKHDVGTLSHSSQRHRHSHGISSVLSTPTHSTARRRR